MQQAVAQIEIEEISITQQPAAQLDDAVFLTSIIAKISWSHHMVLMDKEPHLGKRFWYMLNTLEHGNSKTLSEPFLRRRLLSTGRLPLITIIIQRLL